MTIDYRNLPKDPEGTNALLREELIKLQVAHEELFSQMIAALDQKEKPRDFVTRAIGVNAALMSLVNVAHNVELVLWEHQLKQKEK